MPDRVVKVTLRGDVSDFNRALLTAGSSTRSLGDQLDTASGRMGLLTKSAFALGPALVPISASAVPAVASLAEGLTAAAAAGGVAVLAFQGVGDALSAVNDYSLEPTAANFQKMQEVMATLGPAGRDFVRFLSDLRPEIQHLQDIAQAGLFPGVQEGISELLVLMPQMETIVENVSTALGDLVASAGDALNDPQWVEFFDFVGAQAGPTLTQFGTILGNIAEGFAGLLIAFNPLASDFNEAMIDLTQRFAEFGQSVGQSDGFENFVAYIRANGPAVADALGSVANALVQIVSAAAPVGSAILPVITALADVIAKIASTPVGTALFSVAAGLSAVSLAMDGFSAAKASGFVSFLTSPWGIAAGGVALLAVGLGRLNQTADQTFSAIKHADTVLQSSASTLGDQAVAVDAARQKYEELKKSAEGIFGASEVEVFAAKVQLEALAIQQKENIRDAQDQAFAEAGLSTAMAGASQSARDQTQALIENTAETNANHDAKLAASGGLIAFEQAIDDATESVNKNGKTLDLNTQAGRDNQTALDRLAGAWNDLTPAQQNAEGASERARKKFIQTAVAMGKTKAEAKLLANEILDIPDGHTTDVKLTGADEARRAVRALDRALDSLNPFKRVTVQYNYTATGLANRNAASVRTGRGNADGGYVRGPGTTTSDSIPALLSDREYVVKASAVDHYGVGFFDRLNAQKFASGGLAGRPLAATDYLSRLVEAYINTAEKVQRADEDRSKAERKADERLNKNLEGLSTRVGTLQSTMQSFSDSVGGNFLHDPFNQAGTGLAGYYMSGLEAFDYQVSQDTLDATEFGKALQASTGKGLDGALFEALAASGDLETAQQFAGLSRSQIDQYEKEYAARKSAVSALSAQATAAVYGKDVARLAREIAALREQTELGSRTINSLSSKIGSALADSLGNAGRGAQNRSKNSVRGR